MQDLFHIGIPKSGTTSIQDVLSNDERIHVTRSRHFTSKDWWTLKEEKLPENKIIIESNETLISGGFQKVKFIQVVERMYKTNKNAEVIVTIREQESALKSMFKYHINNNFIGCKTFKHWMFNSNLGMDYISICMYSNIAKSLLSYFPKENIHFLFFEELNENPLSFYKELYKIIGIPFNEKTFENKILNASPFNESQLYTLSKLNRYSPTKVKPSGNNGFKKTRTFENRLKKGIARRFKLKATKGFFATENIIGFNKVKEEFKLTNKELVKMGFVKESELVKHNYLY